jgi:hypothetical protein
MRTTICAITFFALSLVAFLATPGLFKIVNPEYLLALREYRSPLGKLVSDANDAESKIADLQSRISERTIKLKALGDSSLAKQASMRLANASPEEISTVGIDFGSRSNEIGNEIAQLTAELTALKEKKANIETNENELRKKLDAAAADSVNIYVVARALALGAIGALMSIFAKHLAAPTARPMFEDGAAMGRMWASMAMGAIVSVVVIGLFFTGFISIFANATQNAGATDFWKVTILCLLAGAFSDRLFQAAAGKMDTYLHTSELRSGARATGPSRKRTQRTPSAEAPRT